MNNTKIVTTENMRTAIVEVKEHMDKAISACTGSPAQQDDTVTDFIGTLSAATPFDALILKPTAASFNTACSTILFASEQQQKTIVVLFTKNHLKNTDLGSVFQVLQINISEAGQGMFIIAMPNFENGDISSIDPNDIQLFQITDGTNILVPKVNLAELTGIPEADIEAVEDPDDLFQRGSGSTDSNITSIAGCKIYFHFRWSRPSLSPR
jgi:hypothetical protein